MKRSSDHLAVSRNVILMALRGEQYEDLYVQIHYHHCLFLISHPKDAQNWCMNFVKYFLSNTDTSNN